MRALVVLAVVALAPPQALPTQGCLPNDEHTESLLDTAAHSFRRAVGNTGKANRLVRVVRIGTRYVVTDPDERMGEFQVHIIFDGKFKELARFVG